MKKKIKRLGAMLLAGTMAASMLVGCGSAAGGAAPADSSGGTADGAAAPAAAGDIKIGVSIWSSTDVLGSQCKKIVDKAAKANGVEVQYVDQGHVSEQVTASVEQLCAAGCKGIIICNSADSEMTSAIHVQKTAYISHSSSVSFQRRTALKYTRQLAILNIMLVQFMKMR